MRLIAAAMALLIGAQITTVVPRDHERMATDRTAHAPAGSGTGAAGNHAEPHAPLPDGRTAWTRMHGEHEGMPCGDQPLCGWGLMECAGALSCAPVPVLPSGHSIAWHTAAYLTAYTGPSITLTATIPGIQPPPPRA